jgi:protein subunit release factor B
MKTDQGKKTVLTLTKKDFKIDFFRAGGKGGQNRNKVETACRITHLASGVSAEATEERSQHQNKVNAFKRLCAKSAFKKWLEIETARKLGQLADVELKVNEMMKDENLLIEYFES